MNREIKCRGWDNENQKWIYGWLTKLVEGTRKIWAIIQDEEDGLVRYYIHEEKSIGQFTGLLDKNGKEVFGGDILKRYKKDNIPYKQSKIIEWAGAGFINCENIKESVIIGNIYENSDLLK